MTLSAATKRLHRLLSAPDREGLLFYVTAQLSAGADVNAPDSEGFTPLLRCLKAGCAEMDAQRRAPLQEVLAALLRHGAELDLLSPQGHDPATLAAFWNDDGEAAKRLARERYRRSDPYLAQRLDVLSIYWPAPDAPVDAALVRSLLKACAAGDVEKVTYMAHVFPQALGRINDEITGFDLTPLTAAAIGTDARRKGAMLALLVGAGCDINWQNEEGNTALHYACSAEYRSPEAVRRLIALGADETLRNAAGKTPRDMAQDRGFTPPQSCLDALDEALAHRRAQARQNARRPAPGGGFRF